ncbi:putative transporter [Pseudocercospora fuligena]|uniref:Putative transporter n=1 Tax=Pseudocercospora fuligena TaxID=685502 RepID=A0A8H6RUC4_9PEZI|nr:putative transporter [Pseudocercospora fuligena]
MTMETTGDEPRLASERSPLLPKSDQQEHQNSLIASSTQSTEDGNAIPEVSLKAEASILFRYSGPLVVTYFLQYAYQLIIIAIAARLSTEEIAGVSLGITTSNITGYSIFEGFATALDTLCSQAYGSGRMTDVGLDVIRATILVHLTAVIPIGAVWLCSSWIFEALVPQAELAEHASSFLYWTLIGVPGYCAFEHGKRFMQAQGNFNAGLVVLIACLPINLGLTYYLVIVADMRVAGAALSSSLTNLIRPVLLALYAVVIDRSTLQCWPAANEVRKGWRKGWGLIMSLAVPGALMNLSEWLCFEILTFCTTYVGTAALAAQTFLATTTTIVWHVPFSASIACSTRVGQLVGAGMTSSTAKVIRWYGCVFTAIGIVDAIGSIGIVVLMLKTIVHDSEVADIIIETLPFMALFTFFEASSNWPHAVVRGFGWQDIGAWCTVTINYLYALPLAAFLELGSPRLGIRGLWIGLGSGLALV